MKYLKNLISSAILILNLTCLNISVAQTIFPDSSLSTQTAFIADIESKHLLLSNHDKNTYKEITPINGVVFDLLNEANNSILMITFSLIDQHTYDLLNQKAAEGIDVQIVIDRAHMPAPNKLHPAIKVGTRKTGEGHVHHKILVVDRSYIWLGSANFSAHGYTDYKNLVVACYDPVMGEVLHQEAESIQSQQPRSAVYPLSSGTHLQPIELYILPHNPPEAPKPVETQLNAIGLNKLMELIQKAQQEIKISLAIWTHKDSARELIKSFQRGVKVEVVTEDQNQEAIKLIKASGIPVRTVAFIHQKFMFIDDEILLNGSPNWSMNAFSRSDESFIVLYDLSSEQLSEMHSIWSDLWK
jgi:phosphatidylserine/phosphatidylglycerophosphate/cardiolipin synthase-like enzyme